VEQAGTQKRANEASCNSTDGTATDLVTARTTTVEYSAHRADNRAKYCSAAADNDQHGDYQYTAGGNHTGFSFWPIRKVLTAVENVVAGRSKMVALGGGERS
jgi:hypothetical protein